jgi:hypothetical protein
MHQRDRPTDQVGSIIWYKSTVIAADDNLVAHCLEEPYQMDPMIASQRSQQTLFIVTREQNWQCIQNASSSTAASAFFRFCVREPFYHIGNLLAILNNYGLYSRWKA